MKNLTEYKEILDKAYYRGEPLISDIEYDTLFGESGTVGANLGDTPHQYPMFSLQKVYPGDPIPVEEQTVESPKLDGAAISLLYQNGVLTKGLTRGNGKVGQVITNKCTFLVPSIIKDLRDIPVAQITGEVAAHKDIENSRNAASGSLNLKSLDEFATRVPEQDLVFVAYNIQISEDAVGYKNTYKEDMEALHNFGFNTVIDNVWDDRPQDGVVYRINDNKRFNSLGFTAKHPRGAYAFKEKQKPVVTKLLDVVWQCGKSGKVTPVALLEPVMIGDANVSRATLNNGAYIEALDLEIGCDVEVIRSGEIIPCIVGRAD